MSGIRSYGPSLVLAAMTAAVLLGGPTVVRQIAWAEKDAQVQKSRQKLENSPLEAINNAFGEVAKTVEPSVVHLSISRKTDGMSERMLPQLPEDLRRFFERRREQQEEDQDQYEQYDVPQRQGNGSGWVYQHESGKKYIITNNHVIQKADQIEVRFYDKTERTAEVVGTDPATDVAVLKVNDGSLHAAAVSNEPVERGEVVFAFGSPFSFEFSMSQGIVSGKGRRLGILQPVQGYENFIQTDAAINPGNSGGPLTNIRGEVIGMNTAIASRTGTSSGLGFAIPSNMMVRVIDQIIEKGQVSRGYLGIWIKDVSPELAKRFGLDKAGGVLVQDIVSGDSPAAEAGLKPGDIITELAGEPVTETADLRRRVAAFPPDEMIEVKIWRNGETLTKQVTLAEKPDEVAARGGGGRRGAPSPEGEEPSGAGVETLRKLGFEDLSTLTQQKAEQVGIEFTPGALVEDVRSGSVAFSKGLRPGTVITAVEGESVDSIQALSKEIAKHDPAEGVLFQVRVDGVNDFLVLKLPKE